MKEESFIDKKVLITGATGLLGYNLTKALIDIKGIHIILVGRNRNKLMHTYCDSLAQGKITLIEHNISNPLPEEIGKVDFIFHAASPISGKVIKTKPVDVVKSNILGLINCIEYIKEQKHGKIIIFSSATIYPQNGTIDAVSECDTNHADLLTSPNIFYSESKRMIEVISQAYQIQYGVNALIIRLSYVYGYSPNPSDTAFYEFINSAINNKMIRMQSVGLPKRDNIYVEDAVEAILRLCNYGKSGDVYNVSSNGDGGNFASADEIANIIKDESSEILGEDVMLTFENENKDTINGIRLSNEKLKSIGWLLNTSLRDGIRSTIKQYVENGNFIKN